MGQNEQNWTKIDKKGKKLTKLDYKKCFMDKKKTKMDRLQNWTILDTFGTVFYLSDIKDSEVC